MIYLDSSLNFYARFNLMATSALFIYINESNESNKQIINAANLIKQK